jgi:hypothetical protein
MLKKILDFLKKIFDKKSKKEEELECNKRWEHIVKYDKIKKKK